MAIECQAFAPLSYSEFFSRIRAATYDIRLRDTGDSINLEPKYRLGENAMIGMDFISFLILLVISVVVSGILHYGLKYYVTPGLWSFCSKVVVGWVGAWIGSSVIGNWPHRIPALSYGDIWFIPAILGAAGLLIVAVDLGMMARGTRQ
jgi:uncharacterized membrane protein YeaQ/YmgE (transglycosylase-associated protein family)